MNKELKIKITVDKNTGDVKVIGNEFEMLNQKTKKTQSNLSSLDSKLYGLIKTAGGLYVLKQVFDGITGSLSKMTEVASVFETQQSVLTTLEGDSRKAQESFKWIKEFTSNTPYEMQNVGESFLKAKAYGIDPMNDTLKVLGDTASGMGKPLIQAVEAMADAMTGENERLKEFGIKAKVSGDEVAYNWTDTSGKAKHIVVENNSEIIQSTLKALFNSKYEGAMQQQMQTWKGMTSNLSDNYTNFINDIANNSGVFDGMKSALSEINKGFTKITDNKEDMEALGNMLRGSVSGLSTFITTSARFANGIRLTILDIENVISIIAQSGNAMIDDLSAKWLTFTRDLRVSIVELIGMDKAAAMGINIDFTSQQQQITMLEQSSANYLQSVEKTTVEWRKQKEEGLRFNDLMLNVDDTIQNNLNKYTEAIDKNTNAKNNNAKSSFGEDGYSSGTETNTKDELKEIDLDSSAYTTMLDGQLALIDATNTWNNSLEGTAKTIGNVMGAMSMMAKVDITNKKNQSKTSAKLAKEEAKYGEDSIEFAEAENDYIMETSDNKVAANEAQMGAYSALAGAMVGAYEQGSGAALAFSVIQAATGIASSWTAIANAWALPFPANIPAVAMVAANVMPIIEQLGGSGGSSGGVSASVATAEANIAHIEDTTKPITDRLDRQIEIWEALGYGGSSLSAETKLAETTFSRDFKIAVEESLKGVSANFDLRIFTKQGLDREEYIDAMNRIDEKIEGNLFTETGRGSSTMSANHDSNLNMDLLREGTNFLDFLVYAAEDTYAQIAILKDPMENWGSKLQDFETPFNLVLNDMLNVAGEFAVGMFDIVGEFGDARENFEEIYDELTNTNKYANAKIESAFVDFNKLIGKNSYAEYLEKQINAIKEVESIIDKDLVDLLLSSSPGDIQAQVEATKELSRVTGEAFENGITDALNYIESIELVSEAMIKSRENISSFMDSFRSDDSLARLSASNLGVNLAQNAEQLFSQFEKFRNDELGLTDDKLSYLESATEYINSKNEELLESQQNNIQTQIDSYNEYTSTVTSSMSTIKSTITTIDTMIDKLRGASSSSYTLDMFYSSINDAMNLSKTDDYAGLQEAIKDVSSYSSALYKTSNFSSAASMELAQSIAANQLEGIDTTLGTELDYLQQIADNTANT
ncbi:MAG: tape measure protein, partial [Arcobacteraceae bacterium]